MADSFTSFTVCFSSANQMNTSYAYDSMSRLETVSEKGILQATYSYDVNGNLSSKMHESLTKGSGASGIELELEEGIADSELYGYNGFNQLTWVMIRSDTVSYYNGLRNLDTRIEILNEVM